jgi:hypothetical protein
MQGFRSQSLLRRSALIVLFCAAFTSALAVSYVSNTAGDWATTTIWTPNGTPGAADSVTINHAVTMNTAQSIQHIAIGAGGTFTPGSGLTLGVYGNWWNSGTYTTGTAIVNFCGSSNCYIGGSATTTFAKVTVNLNALATTLTQLANVTISLNDTSAMTINVGTWSTNGRDLSVNGGTSAAVCGNNSANGKLDINTGGTVTLVNVRQQSGYQNSPTGLGNVAIGAGTTVNISGLHRIAPATGPIHHICNITGGTVNYTNTGMNLNFDTGWMYAQGNVNSGWYATGGTITFYGSTSATWFMRMQTSGTAVVIFAGGTNSTMTLHSYSGGPVSYYYTFADLRIQKTSGFGLKITASSGGAVNQSFVVTNLLVKPGSTCTLNYSGFATNYGWNLVNVVDSGTIVHVNNGSSYFGNIIGNVSWTGGGNYTQRSATPLPNLTTTSDMTAGTVTDSGTITLGGSLICSGTCSGPGTITFTGTGAKTFSAAGGANGNVIVNKTGGGGLTLNSGWQVTNRLDLVAGTIALGKHTLTLGSATARCSASVASGVTFTAVGGADTAAAIVAAAEAFPYAFTVASGATFGARYANFRYMDTLGVNIAGTVDTANDFDNCSFEHGAISGRMLKIENNQTLDNMQNVGFSGTAGSNIEKLVNAGHIWITTGPGSRWGEAYDNDPNNLVDWSLPDAGVIRIISPVGSYDTGAAIQPSCKVKNFGLLQLLALKVYFRIDTVPGRPPLYRDSALVGVLNPGDSATVVALRAWAKPHAVGAYVVACSTRAPFDVAPGNDTLSGTFTVTSGPPPPPPTAWTAKSPMPAGAKAIKDGGWMAYDVSKARIYATRGQRQPDFFAYAPTGDSWGLRAPWQPGVEGKLPGKGSAGCADGNGVVYATKGNNKSGFWKYDADANAWTQKKDVPLGLSNKKVKGGTDIVWAYKGSVGSPYLLKGYKNEFYRYDTGADSWQTLPPAPIGSNLRWDKGSWLAYDDVNKKIYAFKAKYHEFYRYSPDGDSWSGALAAMPIAGSAGSRKAKDGSCGTYINGTIYALKGANTREFWKYTLATNAWAEKETIPTGLLKKKVKSGADIVTAGLSLYATKGNKSNELWLYAPGAFVFEAPRQDGVLAGRLAIDDCRLAIAPNPLATGFAVLRYGLPKAGAAELSVYNVTGQRVVARTLAAGRSGIVNLDLSHLGNGVYLVKLASEGYVNSQKLVVQR